MGVRWKGLHGFYSNNTLVIWMVLWTSGPTLKNSNFFYCSIALRIIFCKHGQLDQPSSPSKYKNKRYKPPKPSSISIGLVHLCSRVTRDATGLSHLFETHIQKRSHVYNLFVLHCYHL